jgi:hypothetical protein
MLGRESTLRWHALRGFAGLTRAQSELVDPRAAPEAWSTPKPEVLD